MPTRILAVGLAVALAGCAYNPMVDDFVEERHLSGPERLKNLKQMTSNPIKLSKGSDQRDIVVEYGYRIGKAEGIAYRYGLLNQMLDDNSGSLDRQWDFGRFVIDGKLLVPIIYESRNMRVALSDREMAEVDASYTLGQDAKIVSRPPTWRDYLYRQIPDPIKIQDAFLPRREDRAKWRDALDQGWADGVEEAEWVFDRAVTDLEVDFHGHRLFMAMNLQGMLSMPEMESGLTSVVRDGNTLHLNQEVWKVTFDAKFLDVEGWTPVFRSEALSLGTITLGGSDE